MTHANGGTCLVPGGYGEDDKEQRLVKAGMLPLNLGPEETETKAIFKYECGGEIFRKLGIGEK
jgi:hypothetical protein